MTDEPPDVAELLAAERAYLDSDGHALGHGQGDTTPVYVHVRERTDMVIAIERGTYESAVQVGELADLISDRPDDHRRTTYTVIATDDDQEGDDDA